jgi:hypothetical protein
MTELDRPATKPVALALVVALAMIAVSIAAVVGFRVPPNGASKLATPVLQPPADAFEGLTRHEWLRLGREARLHSWTWVDRDHQRVRMPIDLAIDRYLREHR